MNCSRSRPDRRTRGALLIVALILCAIIGLSVTSYIQLGRTSLTVANRALYNNAAMNLAENGLEEAMYAINQDATVSTYSWDTAGWTTSGTEARRKWTGTQFDQNATGEVRVRVSHCGVCHSDLSMVNGSFPGLTPVILGHEAAGTVAAVGEGVTALAPGDRVVLTPTPSCGECYWCVRDEHSLCANSSAIRTMPRHAAGSDASSSGTTARRLRQST